MADDNNNVCLSDSEVRSHKVKITSTIEEIINLLLLKAITLYTSVCHCNSISLHVCMVTIVLSDF